MTKTLRGDYGTRSSRRDEGNADSSIMYVGAPVYDGDEIVGCLTVYKAQSDILPFIKDRRKSIINATVLIGAGILVLIGAVFVWLFRPVGQLTEYVRAVARGERRPKPKVGVGREVNTLANALHDMRESLEGRQYADRYIQTLTHELKSPLAAIRGAAELLNEEMPGPDRVRFLENIRNQTGRCERLNHLLENAIQFSPPGGKVVLALIVDPVSLGLSITDEGEGIPDFARERAFERFYSYRAEDSGKGNGLGLAFVNEVAQLHQGVATIVRGASGGTIARIDLPVTVRDH